MPNHPEIDRALIEHLGELARIRLSADRQAALGQQLQRLVDAFSSLAEVDFDAPAGAGVVTAQGAPVPEHALTAATLRPDEPEPTPSVDRILANAPQTAADCFVVPRVVEA